VDEPSSNNRRSEVTLKGTRVVVIGGTSGIGLATAAAAEERRAEVVVVGRDRQRLEQAARRLGKDATTAQVDATDREQLERLFSGLERVDHLVVAPSTSAGAGALAQLPLDELRAGLEGKLLAYLNTLQAALPHLTSSVTFVSAASAGAPVAGAAGLAAINGAIEAMIPALAMELKPLRVNAVSPGVIDTPWWHDLPAEQREGLFSHVASKSPVGRIGVAEDVAEAILSLAANDFVTGVVLPVDGGFRLIAAA
jgi:NAD(P)-dependent dehydrogenase (short-subunit alcohol dehydrogenase family)